MKILVLNCGSSSLKYQLINMETEDVLASGTSVKFKTDDPDFKKYNNRKAEVLYEHDVMGSSPIGPTKKK